MGPRRDGGGKMVAAYVLITAAVGKVKHVARELERVKGIKSVKVVTGPYDIIVYTEAEDLASITNTVLRGIHKIKGVVDTSTAIVAEI